MWQIGFAFSVASLLFLLPLLEYVAKNRLTVHEGTPHGTHGTQDTLCSRNLVVWWIAQVAATWGRSQWVNGVVDFSECELSVLCGVGVCVSDCDFGVGL